MKQVRVVWKALTEEFPLLTQILFFFLGILFVLLGKVISPVLGLSENETVGFPIMVGLLAWVAAVSSSFGDKKGIHSNFFFLGIVIPMVCLIGFTVVLGYSLSTVAISAEIADGIYVAMLYMFGVATYFVWFERFTR